MLETRLPFQRHLKWLVLGGMSFEQVCQYYDNIQFPAPSRSQFGVAESSIDKLIMPPLTRRRLAKNIFHEVDQQIWKKYGFEEIYLHQVKKQEWPELGRVLNHPVMRVALQCCLAAKISSEEISQLLPTTYALPISEGSIAIFKKYFFDTDDMNKADWMAYLALITEDRYSYTRIFAALTRPRDEVLHLVGLPTKAQFGTMLKNVMSTAHYKFEHYARQSNPDAQEEARKWAKVMIEAGVKHEKFGATDATDFSNLVQTEFEYIDNPITTVAPEMLSEIKPQLAASEGKPDVPELPDTPPPTRPANDI